MSTPSRWPQLRREMVRVGLAPVQLHLRKQEAGHVGFECLGPGDISLSLWLSTSVSWAQLTGVGSWEMTLFEADGAGFPRQP